MNTAKEGANGGAAASGTGGIYSAEQIKIPPRLPDILKDYTKYMLKTQPIDLVEASAEYFKRLANATAAIEPGGLSPLQLESVFNRFYSGAGQDFRHVSVREVIAACEEASISHAQASEILMYYFATFVLLTP
jgi:hypothetical protein